MTRVSREEQEITRHSSGNGSRRRRYAGGEALCSTEESILAIIHRGLRRSVPDTLVFVAKRFNEQRGAGGCMKWPGATESGYLAPPNPRIQATAKILVSLPENPRSYLWVAEIQRDPSREVLMVTQPLPQSMTPAEIPLPMVPQSKLIIEQIDPILDLAFLNGEPLMLDPGRLPIYRRQDDRWVIRENATVPKPAPPPRNVRGRLILAGDSIQAQLPGLVCKGTVRPAFAPNARRKRLRGCPIQTRPIWYPRGITLSARTCPPSMRRPASRKMRVRYGHWQGWTAAP